MGALLQGLVLLQSSIFLVMFFFWGWRLQGGFPHAPPALLQVAPSAACEAHAAQLQALTRWGPTLCLMMRRMAGVSDTADVT